MRSRRRARSSRPALGQARTTKTWPVSAASGSARPCASAARNLRQARAGRPRRDRAGRRGAGARHRRLGERDVRLAVRLRPHLERELAPGARRPRPQGDREGRQQRLHPLRVQERRVGQQGHQRLDGDRPPEGRRGAGQGHGAAAADAALPRAGDPRSARPQDARGVRRSAAARAPRAPGSEGARRQARRRQRRRGQRARRRLRDPRGHAAASAGSPGALVAVRTRCRRRPARLPPGRELRPGASSCRRAPWA